MEVLKRSRTLLHLPIGVEHTVLFLTDMETLSISMGAVAASEGEGPCNAQDRGGV